MLYCIQLLNKACRINQRGVRHFKIVRTAYPGFVSFITAFTLSLTSLQNLVNPYRKFRRDGELKCKKEHSNEKFYEATLFLFNDCVIAAIKMATKAAVKYLYFVLLLLFILLSLICKNFDQS